jgi:hypothetical protein
MRRTLSSQYLHCLVQLLAALLYDIEAMFPLLSGSFVPFAQKWAN